MGHVTLGWWTIAAASGAVAAALILAAIFRPQAARLVRIGRALATDPRLPRPVRWLFAVALAIKTVPLPDGGVDEALLLVGALLLAGPYRRVWRAIIEETR
jgi:hypothetical protein